MKPNESLFIEKLDDGSLLLTHHDRNRLDQERVSFSSAAKLLKEKGARSVRALCTHPVLSGNAYSNIENSVLEELVVCDTIPLRDQSTKIKVLSVADLFAIAIRHAYENQSITSLFIHSQRRNA